MADPSNDHREVFVFWTMNSSLEHNHLISLSCSLASDEDYGNGRIGFSCEHVELITTWNFPVRGNDIGRQTSRPF
jgi:hypothetical protein